LRAFTFDYQLDEADRGKRRIKCPLFVLWGSRGSFAQLFDVLNIWRDWSTHLSGRALDCGHYLPEEAPDETYADLRAFFVNG
jgi:haloacetate dehalogenase